MAENRVPIIAEFEEWCNRLANSTWNDLRHQSAYYTELVSNETLRLAFEAGRVVGRFEGPTQ